MTFQRMPAFFNGSGGSPLPPGGMHCIVDTEKLGGTASATKHFQLPFTSVAGSSYSCTVYWGDGTSDEITAYNQAETLHEYPTGGIYEMAIVGECVGWRFNSGGDAIKLISITQFGEDFSLGNGKAYLSGCTNLESVVDGLDTTLTTLMDQCFYFCGALNNLPLWDLSAVTRLYYYALGCNGIDKNVGIPAYDLSSVTYAYGAFRGIYGALNIAPGLGLTLGNLTNGTQLFMNATIPTDQYSDFLEDIDSVNANTGVPFHGGSSKYNADPGAIARASLVSKTWTITDGGAA